MVQLQFQAVVFHICHMMSADPEPLGTEAQRGIGGVQTGIVRNSSIGLGGSQLKEPDWPLEQKQMWSLDAFSVAGTSSRLLCRAAG